ncbi:hypothetical protein [Nocardia abscessus]|uniref:hypothetical protein n=1 Tax=Nocardia abscessus TaxID=120957 RepID=UPI000308F049|nr:hypothetical protein [Nocardia abscessus]MCC3331663.1 hypothetical protein [Nocardia abscessus]
MANSPTNGLRKFLRGMSCVPAETGEQESLRRLGFAVDRTRDIVRRVILARLCLASGQKPLWPFKDETVKPDIILSDDANRARWRAHWHTLLDSMSLGEAARRAGPQVYSLSEVDL